MRLYIVRHGKAEREAPSGRDEDRELKARGRRQAAWLGEQVAERSPHPELVLSSPVARAAETAKIIRESLGCPLQFVPELSVGVAASTVLGLVKSHARVGSLMVVGHNPTLAELVWVLEHGLPPREAELRTGEACIVELDPKKPMGSARLLERLRMDDEE